MSNNLLESEYNLVGFNMYCINVSTVNRRGIIVYVDSALSSCVLEVDEEFTEFLFVKVKGVKGNSITIGTFYRSPNSSLENDVKLVKLFDSLKSIIPGNLLLLGDFNLPNINWTTNTVDNNSNVNSTAYKFVSCLNDNFLTQHVTFPTRARGLQTPHIHDLVISNDDFVEDVVNLSPLGKSDHSVLHCVCQLSNINVVNVSKFNYNKGDYIGLCDYLRLNIDACYFDNCYSVNDFWINLKLILETGVRLYIPCVDNNTWKKKLSWKFSINLFRN